MTALQPMSMTDRQPGSINPPYRIFMSLLYCMAGQRFSFKIRWHRLNKTEWKKSNNQGSPLCGVCVCLFVCARPASCGGIHGAFLPGLLMRAVRLPDNLAKKNPHSKRKHRHADPGNDGEGATSKTHTDTDNYTHVTVQTKENARRHRRRAQALPE